MQIEDYDAVYRLWKATDGVGMRSLDDSREGIAKFLLRNPKTNFVASKDGEIIGVTLSGHDGRRGYIYHTAVATAYRGRKTGDALVAAVVEAMREEGINKIGLLVFADNDTGISFWEAEGFTPRADIVYMNRSVNDENK